MRRILFFLFCLIALTCQSCTNGSNTVDALPGPTPPTPTPTPTPDPSISVTSLGSGSAVNRSYELYKISKSGWRDSYVQWFPPTAQPGPVLIHIQPYYGISWGQDPIDQEWANRANASTGYDFQDVNGPLYDANVPNKVHYQLMTPQAVAEESAPYLLNNVGVLIVYGRFYAGGSISQTLESVQLAFQFLQQQSSVNPSRIGIFGFSFGGFQSLYGAATAPSGIIPKVGVAWAPLMDFEAMDQYATQQIPSQVTDAPTLARYNEFFNAYLRRTYAATGGSTSNSTANYSSFTNSFLNTHLATPFLLIQNEWDTLIPINAAKRLVQDNPLHAQGFWFPQATQADPSVVILSHLLTEQAKYLQPASVFAQAHLLSQLMESTDGQQIQIVYSSSALKSFFSYLRSQQNANVDFSLVKNRLLSLTDSRMVMMDTDHQMPTLTGLQFVSWALHVYWGVLQQPENIVNFLNTNNFPSTFQATGVSLLSSSSTDPAITFRPSANHLYRHCTTGGCTDPETLFVFFPGSDGSAVDFQKIITAISNKGIPAIALQYENIHSLNSLCVVNSKTVSEQNTCFSQARYDRIEGAMSSTYVSSSADGIVSRLQMALKKLQWYQFLNVDGSLKTQKIIFGGFSQGSGMAAWMGKTRSVKRVCQFAGTWDYTNDFAGTTAPATWLSGASLTSSTLFFGFSHQNDSLSNGINFLNILWNQLGMPGSPLNMDSLVGAPTGQKLYSASTGGLCSSNAHSCTVADAETPVDAGTGIPLFQAAWLYTCLGLYP